MKARLLSLAFDARGLARDLEALASAVWRPHFNTGYHDGGWSGVALRSRSGSAEQLYPDLHSTECATDTDVLARCPSIAAALGAFRCELRAVRLLRLAPGATIREHRDYRIGFEEGLLRLHVPLLTSPLVEFYLDGERISMTPGECWYLDFSLPHRVFNGGSSERVHLVLDCEANDWLRTLIAQGSEPDRHAFPESSLDRLERFRRIVETDSALAESLVLTTDVDSFIALVVAAGKARDLDFAAEDVRSHMDRARRSWMEQWIVR